jgi:hypothetical protein
MGFWSGLFSGESGKADAAKRARGDEAKRQATITGQLNQVREGYGEIDPQVLSRKAELDTMLERGLSREEAENWLYDNGKLRNREGGLIYDQKNRKDRYHRLYGDAVAGITAERDALAKTAAGAEATKKSREGTLAAYDADYQRSYGRDLTKQYVGAKRSDLFLGADTGTVGGAADRVRQKRRLGEFLGGRQTIAANAARSVDDIRKNEQDERLALEDLVRSGNADQLSIDRGLSSLKSNADIARSQIGAQQLGDFFTQAGNLNTINTAATNADNRRRLFSTSSAGRSGTASGTIT